MHPVDTLVKCSLHRCQIEIFNVNTLSGKLNQLASPNLQDIFTGRKASLGLKVTHSEKQDGRRLHFFENYLPFSTGWFSQVEG